MSSSRFLRFPVPASISTSCGPTWSNMRTSSMALIPPPGRRRFASTTITTSAMLQGGSRHRRDDVGVTVALGGQLLPGPFNHRWYVPILLTRQGERHALRVTPRSIKDRFTPLFVVHPVALDPRTGSPKQSVQEHLEKLVRALVND